MSRNDYVLISVAALSLVIVGVLTLPSVVYGGVLGIIGVVIGAFLPRWVARVGAIYCKAAVVDSTAAGIFGTIGEKPSLPVDYEAFSAAAELNYWLDVFLFNERDRPTGLRNLAVLFQEPGGKVIERPVFEKIVDYPGQESSPNLPEQVHLVNLPSGEWVHLELMMNLDLEVLGREKEAIEQYNRAEICGLLPDGTAYSHTIDFPDLEGRDARLG
jgi:hypothetical protein